VSDTEIERVYFSEAPYVGPESYQSLPPVQDMDPARRKAWTFLEDAIGVVIEQRHSNGKTYTALVPWHNVKGIVYVAVQSSPAAATPSGGKQRG
jgi:hypothetical protein